MQPSARLKVAMVAVGLTTMLTACSAMSGDETSGQYVDDGVITAKVKSGLAEDAGLKAANAIHVETFRDVVQLSGFVDDPTQKARAEQIAWAVKGVRGVKDDIAIK